MTKFECPRVCYDTQDDFKVLGIEKATTDEDNEEGTLGAKSVLKQNS